MKTNKELDEVIRNKVKASFVMIKIFYPSENLDLIVLEYDDNFCACELYYKNGHVRGWRTYCTDAIIDLYKNQGLINE